MLKWILLIGLVAFVCIETIGIIRDIRKKKKEGKRSSDDRHSDSDANN